MLQSQLVTKTRKEAPKDEVSKNAILLMRAGFVDKLTAGVYSYLPLGLRVLKNIENIVRKEMNKAGGQELFMPSLNPKENWEKTGRWDSMDDLFKLKDKSDREFALGPTHEEIVVPLVQQFASSYKDMPFAVYQFQNKFRMELRAKSGILRGREFLMKDMYSFHTDEADLVRYYNEMKTVYKKVFDTVGIGDKTYLTFASGGSFSKYSHEFQTITPAGEDTIYICDKCRVAVNKEIAAEKAECPECGNTELREEKAIEVGNIFELKTKFSAPFGFTVKGQKGEEIPVTMGCYGIGIGRLMGTVVEVMADEKGLVWPENIAPFPVHLIDLSGNKEEVRDHAKEIYTMLEAHDIEVLFDDRAVSAGEKFADADLIGIPWRVVVSEKTMKEGVIEVKNRKTGEVTRITPDELRTNVKKSL